MRMHEISRSMSRAHSRDRFTDAGEAIRGFRIESAFVAFTKVARCPSKTLFASEAVLTQTWNHRRRVEFASGRECARTALKCSGLDSSEILRHSNGAPAWPPHVRGSITHCADFYAAVVGSDDDYSGLGLDAEPNIRLPLYLTQRFAAADELNNILALQEEHPYLAWDRLLFCAKEAIFKAVSESFGQSLGALEMQIRFDPRRMRFIARCDLHGRASRDESSVELCGSFFLVEGTILALVLVRRLRT